MEQSDRSVLRIYAIYKVTHQLELLYIPAFAPLFSANCSTKVTVCTPVSRSNSEVCNMDKKQGFPINYTFITSEILDLSDLRQLVMLFYSEGLISSGSCGSYLALCGINKNSNAVVAGRIYECIQKHIKTKKEAIIRILLSVGLTGCAILIKDIDEDEL